MGLFKLRPYCRDAAVPSAQLCLRAAPLRGKLFQSQRGKLKQKRCWCYCGAGRCGSDTAAAVSFLCHYRPGECAASLLHCWIEAAVGAVALDCVRCSNSKEIFREGRWERKGGGRLNVQRRQRERRSRGKWMSERIMRRRCDERKCIRSIRREERCKTGVSV